MAKVFTPELREEVKARIVELVCRDGRKTRKQLENETGATRHLIEVLAKELVVSGAVQDMEYFLRSRPVRTGEKPAKKCRERQ